MRILHSLTIVLSFLLILGGMVINNLWRLLPEFHTLDTIWSTPLAIQATPILTCAVLGLLTLIYKKKSLLIGYFIFFTITPFSWNHAIFSNSTNSLSLINTPFFDTEILFSDLESISFNDRDLKINSKNRITLYRTGFYPFGLSTEKIKTDLQQYGNCVILNNNPCGAISISSP